MTENCVVLERTLTGPIDLVWRMWTEAEQFAAWYGPPGAEITVKQMDVRVGGGRFLGMTMTTPDGAMTMWFTGEYTRVDEPTALGYTDALADESGTVLSPAAMGMPDDHPMVTQVSVTLTSEGDRTHLRLRHEGVPADSPGAQGWAMALDKLERALTER